MKSFLWMVVAALMLFSGVACAQTSLVGREYHNANIFSGKFRDFDKMVEKTRTEAIAKAEKEKGRKLNADEMKKLDEQMKEARARMKIMKEGTVLAMTITFKDAKKASVKARMKVSDEVLKEAGYGWVKRKAMKAAMAIMPAQTATYTVKGNLVILRDEDNETDTLRLSADGKHLNGFFGGKDKDNSLSYSLTRTK